MNGVVDSPPSLETIGALVKDGAFEETLSARSSWWWSTWSAGGWALEPVLAWYEAGLGLTRRCSQLLEQAELRISALDAENPMRAA